jgi:hypothetical protein
MKLIAIISIFISTIGFSQIPNNKLDNTSEYLFQLINEFRSKQGLNALVLDSGLLKASIHHTNYMMVYCPSNKEDGYSHYEYLKDSSNIIESIDGVVDRANRFGANITTYKETNNGLDISKKLAENVLVRNITSNFDLDYRISANKAMGNSLDLVELTKSTNARNKLFESSTTDTIDYKATAEFILYEWLLSPPHRKALLDSSGTFGAVYQSVTRNINGTISVYSTFMISFAK